MFVNDSREGGCAATVAVAYNGPEGLEVQTHEFGHSFADLADEYDYGKAGTYSGPEPDAINITAGAQCSKWAVWQGIDGVACFEGAGYYQFGLYRPEHNCTMREIDVGHCEVCSEGIIHQTHLEAPLVGRFTPFSPWVSRPSNGTLTFTIDNLVPGGGAVTWFVDGLQKQSGGNSFTYTFGQASHLVRVKVEDTTPRVRRDPHDVMSTSWTWVVSP